MKILAYVLAVVSSVLVLVTGMMAMFAPMAMDAPDSHKSSGKWLFVCAMMLSPLALLGGAIMAWTRIGEKVYPAAIGWCIAGLLPFGVAMFLLQNNWFEK